MINLLNINRFIKDNNLKGPITSSNWFLGKNTISPHPAGLFSEDIFGIEGSKENRTAYSWIELNCNVIHPVVYDIMSKRIEKKIESLISGEKVYTFDQNGLLKEDENGELDGFTSLYENRMKWRFREGEDEEGDRNKIINVFYKNIKEETFFMNKLLVIPISYRPLNVDKETASVLPDELNELYQRVIILSKQLENLSGTLYDILSYRMQVLMKSLYELIKNRISKKEGMIRNLMLGKRVDYSARTVITPDPTIGVGEVGVPLRIVCQIFEPFLLYGLTNSSYAHTIPDEFHIEIKKFLKKESQLT